MTLSKKIGELINEYYNLEMKGSYKIGYIQYQEDISKKIYDHYRDVILMINRKPKKLKYKVKEAGEYLIAYHKGHWENIGETYQRLIEYANKHHLQLEPVYYESCIVDEMMVDGYANYVTEIQVGIKAKK